MAVFTKWELLSLLIFTGIPHRGIISVMSTFATAPASALDVGNASTHFENMSTITKQYFFPSLGDSSIKSICRCSNGASGGGCAAGVVRTTRPTLLVAQMIQASQIFVRVSFFL